MADEPKPGNSESPAPAAKPASPKPPAPMAATPWDGGLASALQAAFAESVLETSTYLGQNFIVARPEPLVAILEYLKLEADFDYLVDITAVDWPKRADRFELIYVLYSYRQNQRIRVKASVPEGYKPQSAVSVYRGANWLEREVFDMFGIEFVGHPGLRRILLPDEWQGHPLRKDYGIVQQDQRWVQENLGIESGQ